ncbi:NRDE family protein [soil metagenome]
MCTVTLTPLPGDSSGFILTSNRDELPSRETLAPDFYSEKGVKMLYPKDKIAGGSWIGVSERSRLLCLLNGGFEAHTRRAAYRLSRGVVLKDLLAAPDLVSAINNYHLEDVEPFTVIAADWQKGLKFYEFVWDGKSKFLKDLDLTGHIWSSSPLYDPGMRGDRQKWFSDFIQKEDPAPESLWNFYHSAGVGNREIDVIMDRGFIKTKSITQVIHSEEGTKMIYKDLSEGNITERIFSE